MTKAPILLLVSDLPVLSSLQFSLDIEGFDVMDAASEGNAPSAAAALVIDQGSVAAGLAALAAVRSRGCGSPAIVLATNPTKRIRAQVAAEGAILVEKPLLGDELTRALRNALNTREAA